MSSEPRNYELYRNSSLGVSLRDTVDELINHAQISAELGNKVLLQFDKSFCSLLATKVKNKSKFEGHLHTYRFCDNVWTFTLEKAEFRFDDEIVPSECIKIVACDAKDRQAKSDL